MSLHGKTTIQLFDSKTGELVNEVSESNLVTNAVSNIFNSCMQAYLVGLNSGKGRRGSINSVYTLPSDLNLAQTLYGGVLVFSNSIEANIEHCIPSIDEIKSCIGYANQDTATSSSIFKGTFNSAESSISDNEIVFVWDFSESQCNGKIASICLTSNAGGATGLVFDTLASKTSCSLLKYIYSDLYDVSGLDFSSSYIHAPMFLSSYTSSGAHGQYISGDYYYYIYRGNAYKYNISKILNKNWLRLTDNFKYCLASSADETITLSNTYTGIFKCLDSDKVFKYNTSQSSVSSFVMTKIYGNCIEETVTIPTTDIISSVYSYFNSTASKRQIIPNFASSGAIFNNSIYFLIGTVNNSNLETYPNKVRIYKLNFDGSFSFNDINCTDNFISMMFGTKSYGNSPTSAIDVQFNKMFDSLVLTSVDSTLGYVNYIVNSDCSVEPYPFLETSSNISNYGYDLYKNETWLKEPWCSFKFAGNGYVNTIELFMAYLGTINNMTNELTKTSSNTMKIKYTLTQN